MAASPRRGAGLGGHGGTARSKARLGPRLRPRIGAKEKRGECAMSLRCHRTQWRHRRCSDEGDRASSSCLGHGSGVMIRGARGWERERGGAGWWRHARAVPGLSFYRAVRELKG
jgi:hypothetical protein